MILMEFPDIYNLDHFNINNMIFLTVEYNKMDITLTYNDKNGNIITHHTGNIVNGKICYNLNLGAYIVSPKSKIWMKTYGISGKMKNYLRKPLFDINDLDNGYLLLQFAYSFTHIFYIINNPSLLVDDIIYNITQSVQIPGIKINYNLYTDDSYARFIIFTNNMNYNPLLTPTDITKMTFIQPFKTNNMVYHIYKVNNGTIMMYLKYIIDDITHNIISIKNNKIHHNKEYCNDGIYFAFDGTPAYINNELFNKYLYCWRFISLYNQSI